MAIDLHSGASLRAGKKLKPRRIVHEIQAPEHRGTPDGLRLTEGSEPGAEDEFRRLMATYGQRHDVHTGLLNYECFQDSLAAMLREASAGQEIALLWIELENLRREFSLRGRSGSEALVRQAAGALRSAVSADALVGRFSGRCFVVAMKAAKLDPRDRRRLQSVVNALLPSGGAALRPEVAAGLAFYPRDTESAEDLVRFASLAASRAEYLKSSTAVTFQPGMNNVIMRNHQLELEMHKGLKLGQFSVAYQPKVDLVSGRVLGAETLVRWNHPERGAVRPSEFIPIAERSGLIHPIFEFTLRAALRDLRKWHQLGLSLPVVSVNASAVNLRRDDLARTVRNILADLPIKPALLELEVTESVLFDDEELFTTRVRQLKEIGVRVAIDDFGTRYTGFNVLKHVRLDSMKIDQCFIRGIDRSVDMRALCQTIVAMARQLKMRTVAEGIEEPGELDVMREIGCEAGQGYLFQRPVSASEFAMFLRGWPARMGTFGYTSHDRGDAAGSLVETA
jgi:EAL domain-containing protein (putative c-di-GMP-specific phosphodiesterase class I)/GGDEF domain-containing protein